jgi:type I restriction enzyme R subunit
MRPNCSRRNRFKPISDEAKRAEFREKLSGDVRVYAFISQIVPYADPEMEMLYSYGRFLVPHLPIERDLAIKLTDEVGLQYYCFRTCVYGLLKRFTQPIPNKLDA